MTDYRTLAAETEIITTREIKKHYKIFQAKCTRGGYSHQISSGESSSQHDQKFRNNIQRLSCN